MTSTPSKLIAAMIVGAAVFAPVQAARAQNNEAWTRPFRPFKMIGNIYWVGSFDLSTFLITTPQGHILINTGVGDTAKHIQASVEQLGFKMSDVKILTATHGHFDHVAGMADLKRMTGAALVISERDKELLESGGKADFRWGDSPGARFDAVKVDRTFADGGTISLGGTVLTAHLHAGHTKGATSFTTDVRENGRTYRVIIANMGSINPGVTVTGMPRYPGIAEDYARTFTAQKAMKIDVWLSSHAGQFRMHDKYNRATRTIPTGSWIRAAFSKRSGGWRNLPRSSRQGADRQVASPPESPRNRAKERNDAMLMTTTSMVEGKPVSRYLGVVTGEAIIGANVFRDCSRPCATSSAAARRPTSAASPKRARWR